MMPRLWSYLLFGGLCLSAVPARTDDAEMAKLKIEEGKRLIKEENYAGALEAFKASYALRPRTWLLFNIGMCQKALHRYADAIATFNKYLRLEEKGEKSNFKTLDLALKAVDELEQLVGKVRLLEAPDNAKVVVDGTPVATTPLESPLVLDPGRHRLQISKPGFQRLEIDVIVNSGAEVEVRASLERPKADIKVECKGDDTVVLIDGAEVGTCPFSGEVEAGDHHIKVIAPEKSPFESVVQAESGSTLVIAVELKPDTQMVPPTFMEHPPKEQPGKAPLRWMRVTGIAAGGVGAVSLITAGVLTSKWSNQYDVVSKTVKDVDNANWPETLDVWNVRHERYENEADRANNLKSGFISTYAIGGTLIAVGATFMILDLIKHPKESEVAVRTTPNGALVEF